MQDLLKEVRSLQGVMGALVYTKEHGIVGSNFPSILQNRAAGKIERLLAHFAGQPTNNQFAPRDIEIRFQEGLLLIKPVTAESFLMILSEPSINMGLVNMTTKMLVTELGQEITRLRDTPPPPKARDGIGEVRQAPDYAQLLNESPLAAQLQQIKEKLNAYVGPVGNMLMRETVVKWAEDGDVTAERLAGLIDLLCVAIDDPVMEKEFRKAVGPIAAAKVGRDIPPKATPPGDHEKGKAAKNLQTLEPIFAKIQEALTDAIGPAGGFIMDDAVRAWKNKGVPMVERLGELIDMLCREIDDKELEPEFRAKVAPFL